MLWSTLAEAKSSLSSLEASGLFEPGEQGSLLKKKKIVFSEDV
jgi:hypothetical protein